MFFIPAALILYALATFGAVRPKDWLAVAMGFLIGIAACLIYTALKRNCWHYSLMLLAGSSALFFAGMRSKLLLCGIAGFLVWVAAKQGRSHTLRFLRVLVFVGVAEAVLGLAQYLISPGWIFGYVNTAYRVSGTLINHNHFAGLLEMFIPVTFGFAYIGVVRFRDVARSYVYLLAGAVMGLALLFSTSRMGIFSFFTTVFFLAILLRAKQSRRRLAAGFTLTIGGLVMAAALWVGIDVVLERYAELLGEEAILREGRLLVYRDTVKMIREHPFGVGSGNYQDRFRQYQTYRPDLLFDHAHNDYLETAAEWGLPLAIGFWSFIGFAFVRAVRLFLASRSAEQGGILLACIGAVFSILVHSFADFNLQIPSNAMLFFNFVGISLALPFSADRPKPAEASGTLRQPAFADNITDGGG